MYNLIIKKIKGGLLWLKLKVPTEEQDLKDLIKNLVVRKEEELDKLGKNNFPILTNFQSVL